MKALEGICNEKLPDPSPGEPILGEKCKKAEKDASGKCKGFFIKGSQEPFFACSICEEKAEDPEEVESSRIRPRSPKECSRSLFRKHNQDPAIPAMSTFWPALQWLKQRVRA